MNIDQVARLAEALTGGDAGAIEDANRINSRTKIYRP
jgi:hypothetical protein